MKFKYIMLEYAILAIVGLAISAVISVYFLLVELWLLIIVVIYNVKPIRSKDIMILDVISESVNNMIRLLLGWFAITSAFLPPVSVLFGYGMAGAFLMGTKRLAEYRMINDSELASKYRRSFRFYTEKTLLASSFFYGLCATFFIGIFLVKYRIEYLIAMPVLFGLFAYYIALAYNEDSAVQKPEKLYKERKLLGIVLLFVILLAVMTVVDIPILHSLMSPHLISL